MIVPLTLDHARHIAHALREDDKREVYAVRWTDDADDLAQDCIEYPGPKYAVLADDGTPVAMGGFAIWLPTVAQCWLMGTDRIGENGVEIIHAARATCREMLGEAGFMRIQVHTAAFRKDAHRWLQRIGFECDGELPCYGRDGSGFYVYSMIGGRNHVRRRR